MRDRTEHKTDIARSEQLVLVTVRSDSREKGEESLVGRIRETGRFYGGSSGAGAIRHGGARALPLLELAGHGGAQVEQERLPGWAPSLCHKILHCILQVYADCT